MDNDVLVLSGWLKHLQRTAEQHKAIAMVGAKLLQTDAEAIHNHDYSKVDRKDA